MDDEPQICDVLERYVKREGFKESAFEIACTALAICEAVVKGASTRKKLVSVQRGVCMNEQPTPAELMSAIVDLHGAVSLGFSTVDKRLTGVETRLTSVETRLTGVETRLTGVEGRVAGLERWTVHADARFERIDCRLDAIEKRRTRRS